MTLEELSRSWSSKGTENGRLQEQIWDRRAEDYEAKSLPSCGTNPFLKYLCEKVPMNGELSLLDVGCGAGRFSLALAGRVREAAGIDVSGNMIAAARRLAAEKKFSHLQFYKGDWASADLDALGFREHFDLVFAHMTPAVADYETLDKMNASSKRHCILVKPARRANLVEDAALARAGMAGQREQLDDAIPNTFAYLWMKGYEPEFSYRKEEWRSTRSLSDMEAWCVDRASLQKTLSKEEEASIRAYLREISKDGSIEEVTTTTIVTIYWEKRS